MPSILQVIGLIAIVLGVSLIYWPAGLIAAGVACVLLGVALELSERREDT